MFVRNIIFDAVVIGGGFYGVAIASYLATARGLKNIVLIEREESLLSCASLKNQARVHNGYHYPRSFTTAYRSRHNFPKFVTDWSQSIVKNFTSIYAIARYSSKVTSRQFEVFCDEISAAITPADKRLMSLFNTRLISNAFVVDEYTFDADILRKLATKELTELGINVMVGTSVNNISGESGNKLGVTLNASINGQKKILTNYVFNCTYSSLNQINGNFENINNLLKHEITELALIRAPKNLSDFGITVMDGPFFSMLPYPSRGGLHSLSHVRYTPHFSWKDEKGLDPSVILEEYEKKSRIDRMIRDASRYLPSILQSEYIESLFEIKTILAKNEIDDGRPILFHRHEKLEGFYSILGGKIDNVYDIFKKLDHEVIVGESN